MSKIAIRRLDSTTKNDTAATALINENFSTIQSAIDNSISRDGTTPNFMNANLDMNSYRIINAAEAVEENDVVTLKTLNDRIGGGVTAAVEAAEIAQAAATSAENSAVAASDAASYAEYYAKDIKFGMYRYLIRVSDWQQSGNYYTNFIPDVGIVSGVYKVSGNNFNKVECNIKVTPNGTTISSIKPFAGFCLVTQGINEQFVYEQENPSMTWTIEHNLGKYPTVTCIDGNGYVIIQTTQYVDLNTVELTFTEAVAGKAILS